MGFAAGDGVPVLGERIEGQSEVAQRGGEGVGLQEPSGVGAVAAGAHVGLGAGRVGGAGVDALAGQEKRIGLMGACALVSPAVSDWASPEPEPS
jgi:hypothetical protein